MQNLPCLVPAQCFEIGQIVLVREHGHNVNDRHETPDLQRKLTWQPPLAELGMDRVRGGKPDSGSSPQTT